MDDAFLIVVVVVSLLALVVALLALATSAGSYDRIGRGGLSLGEDPPPGATGAAAERELAAEVRQVVEARNARRLARGEPPLDVEGEVSKRLREM